jgi:FAD/FMN-containing dehydrogenase
MTLAFKMPRRRIWLLPLLLLALPVAFLARPLAHLLLTSVNDWSIAEPLAPGVVDDASRLNRTHVAEVWPIPRDVAVAEQELVKLIERARREKLPIAIAGARHSMGGHTISPGGIVLDMLPFHQMALDASSDVLHVQAGARWSEIIPYLDKLGWSVAVMQSNDSFSVGGSISVNCHGWQHNHAPIASTVESFRLLKADATIVRCSREENQELFSLVLGGYGLFGVILDVDLRVVRNQRYRVQRYDIAAEEYVSTFQREVNGQGVASMVFGRLSVAPDHFLDEAILTVFRDAPSAEGRLPALTDPKMTRLKRSIFRGSAGSDYGKTLRWQAEKKLQRLLEDEHFSRNQLLNESVDIFADRSAETTDILHEYFIPPDQFNNFVRRLRETIPRHRGDLLNVTIRNVRRDDDAYLRYADRELFALVLLFVQARSPAGEAQMAAMTRDLINAALDCDGRYYLPYRLHATSEQFNRAYPRAREFFELKRLHDPDELFQNQYYIKYGDSRFGRFGSRR